MAKNKNAAAREKELLTKIQELYPDYAFFFQPGAGEFGDDVRALLIRAVTQDYTNERFLGEYRQTNYYNTVSAAVKEWNAIPQGERTNRADIKANEIRESYGDLFDFQGGDQLLTKIANDAARLNLDGGRLRNYVFMQARNQGGPAVATQSTAEADKLKQIASDYGYKLSQSEIDSVLTGTPEPGTGFVLTAESLRERAKMALLGEMPHLKAQIDSGLTPSAIFRNYRQEAANVLGLDPNSISFEDPKWRKAISARDENGNVRQLSLDEWRRTLRTDPEYGFQYTVEANQNATDLALTLARAFGKVTRR